MKTMISTIIGLGMTFCAGLVMAQDDEMPDVFTYATYFYCDVGNEETADTIMERNAPLWDKLVDDGAILGWGWMSHHTGGQWRRIRWHQSDSLVGAMAALDTMTDVVEKKYGEDDAANADFAAACPRHDDYVWQLENGMSGEARGKAGFSVYYKCDIAREERADEIIEAHAKPILDKMVEDGGLTSWGWQSHLIGGSVRRLQTMTAEDLPTLLTSRTALIEAMYPEDDAMGIEFADICGPHVDYIWDLDLGKP